MFDGKKVKRGGDVDLLGFEGDNTLNDRIAKKENKERILKDSVEIISSVQKETKLIADTPEQLILKAKVFNCLLSILPQTPNATRNVTEIYRNKFCRQTSLIEVSQKWSPNMLKPLIIFYRLGITELCSDWSKRYFPIFRVFLTF